MLDYEWEPAKLVEDDKGIVMEAQVFRDGLWVDVNWADLYRRAKIATPEVFAVLMEWAGGTG